MSQLANSTTTFVAVNHNKMTNVTHIDLLYAPRVSVRDIGDVCSKTYLWLRRTLIAEMLRRRRGIFAANDDDQVVNRRDQLLLERRIRAPLLMRKIMEGVIRFLLPEGYSGSISQFMPTTHNGRATSAFPVRFELSENVLVESSIAFDWLWDYHTR